MAKYTKSRIIRMNAICERLGVTRAGFALEAPFFVWLAGIAATFLPLGFYAPAYVYAGKTAVCAALVLALRPWRFVRCSGTWRDIVLGVLVGVAVYVLWAWPECVPWAGVREWYYRWLVMPIGGMPDYAASWCYAWGHSPALAVAKLIGSAFVIAPIEEFFFRGCLMRWLSQRDWRGLVLNAVTRQAFWATALVFAFEHDRYVAGLLAGLAYGGLAVRTGSLAAPIAAHVTTNLILAIHVLAMGAYHFW